MHWRYFPLEQVNSDKGPDWKLWEQPASHRSRGRSAFHGALAAKNQGDDAFREYHHGLLRATHANGLDHGRRQTLIQVATDAGLEIGQFEADLNDRALLGAIGEDYEEARGIGVFGTPTFVFSSDAAIYLKLDPKVRVEEPALFFETFVKTAVDRPYMMEMKRPTRPTP